MLDKEELESGEEALIRLRLEEVVVCVPGDPFILRLASPAMTLGGGVIVEESKYRLKRFKNFVLDELAKQTDSLASLPELLTVQLLRARLELVELSALAFTIKRSSKETKALLEELRAKGTVWANPAGDRWMHQDHMKLAGEKLVQAAEKWFAGNSHRQVMDVTELRREFNWDPALFAAVLENQRELGTLVVESGGRVKLKGREIELDDETRALTEQLTALLTKGELQPPSPADLAVLARAKEA